MSRGSGFLLLRSALRLNVGETQAWRCVNELHQFISEEKQPPSDFAKWQLLTINPDADRTFTAIE